MAHATFLPNSIRLRVHENFGGLRRFDVAQPTPQNGVSLRTDGFEYDLHVDRDAAVPVKHHSHTTDHHEPNTVASQNGVHLLGIEIRQVVEAARIESASRSAYSLSSNARA